MDTTQTEPITLQFDRLDDGTLVAVHSGVAAIVHPSAPCDAWPGHVVRWGLAGPEWVTTEASATRPQGQSHSRSQSCAEAAEALGAHLGARVAGWAVNHG